MGQIIKPVCLCPCLCVRVHRRNFRGDGGSGPPLFCSGRTDPHFISTPSQKFCSRFTPKSMVWKVRGKLRHCLCVRLRTLSRSHFWMDFHRNWHRH